MGRSIGARVPSFSTVRSVYTNDPPLGKHPSELPDSSQTFGIIKMQWEIVERFLTRLVAASQRDPLRILLLETVILALFVMCVSLQLSVISPGRMRQVVPDP